MIFFDNFDNFRRPRDVIYFPNFQIFPKCIFVKMYFFLSVFFQSVFSIALRIYSLGINRKMNEDLTSESKNTEGEVITSIEQKYRLLFASSSLSQSPSGPAGCVPIFSTLQKTLKFPLIDCRGSMNHNFVGGMSPVSDVTAAHP